MFVTRHTNVVDPALSAKLWHLYEVSYAGMSEQAVTREVLYRSEFDAAIADPTNRLWVLWDDDSPVAMTLIATEIGPTRYLSRGYFDGRFPEHTRRGAVHYIMWLVVHPMYAAQGAIVRLAREVLQREADDGALLVFDCPEVHQPGVSGGFAEMMHRLANAFVGPAPVQHLGTSYYYAVDFGAVADRKAVAEQAEPQPAHG